LNWDNLMYRLRMVKSTEDLREIAKEIDPDDEETDRKLAGMESTLRIRGDTSLADRFKALRDFSHLSQTGSIFDLPDVPGADDAALEVRQLVQRDKNEPLPWPHCKSFFPVLRSFKTQAQEKGLADLAASFADLERRALAQSMLDWVEAKDWQESRAYLQDHQELLCDEVALMLSEMSEAARAQNKADVLEVMEQHHSLLERARQDGIEAAYAGFVDADDADGDKR
jgi:hypothetical protein